MPEHFDVIIIGSLGHQVGTCKFGEDPKTSVLDLNCRAHDLDNLYVVDGSFFVSSGAVNPTLTIIANALRVGDNIMERLGSGRCEDSMIPGTLNPSVKRASTEAQLEPVFAQ